MKIYFNFLVIFLFDHRLRLLFNNFHILGFSTYPIVTDFKFNWTVVKEYILLRFQSFETQYECIQ